MNESELSLGQALAYLKAIDGEEKISSFSSLSDSAQNYISNLCRFRDDLNSDELINGVLATIPNYTCQSSKSYLKNNIKFFIALLIIRSENYSCEQLIKHLNSCFCCFDVFCHVLRDYFHTSNDIIVKTQV